MKKIYLTLIIAFLFTNFTFGQTLMSDEDHATMINGFSSNVDLILLTECPQGMTVDQFKNKIINGEIDLSWIAKSSIHDYAETLITYGTQFAAAKGLTANGDAEKYFLASFAPSTLIDSSGNLIESNTIVGLTGMEIWKAALDSFNTDSCGISALVSNKNNLNALKIACVNKLTPNAGSTGVAIMMGRFVNRMKKYNDIENTAFAISRDTSFVNIENDMNSYLNQSVNQTVIDEYYEKFINVAPQLESDDPTLEEFSRFATTGLGFPNVQSLNDFKCSVSQNLYSIHSLYLNRYADSFEDQLLVFNSVNRYSPDQSIIIDTNTAEYKMTNFGPIFLMGSCSGIANPTYGSSGVGMDIGQCILDVFGLGDIMVAIGGYIIGGGSSALTYGSFVAACEGWAAAVGWRAALTASTKILANVLVKTGTIFGAAASVASFAWCMHGLGY